MDIEPDALWLGLNRPRVIWEPLPPAVWNVPDMRAAIGRRDIGAVYKILQKYGVSQRRIAALTGQSQSEISEILGRRRVHSYDLLVRICEGLGIPRGWMGLAYVSRDGEDSASRGSRGRSARRVRCGPCPGRRAADRYGAGCSDPASVSSGEDLWAGAWSGRLPERIRAMRSRPRWTASRDRPRNWLLRSVRAAARPRRPSMRPTRSIGRLSCSLASASSATSRSSAVVSRWLADSSRRSAARSRWSARRSRRSAPSSRSSKRRSRSSSWAFFSVSTSSCATQRWYGRERGEPEVDPDGRPLPVWVSRLP